MNRLVEAQLEVRKIKLGIETGKSRQELRPVKASYKSAIIQFTFSMVTIAGLFAGCYYWL